MFFENTVFIFCRFTPLKIIRRVNDSSKTLYTDLKFFFSIVNKATSSSKIAITKIAQHVPRFAHCFFFYRANRRSVYVCCYFFSRHNITVTFGPDAFPLPPYRVVVTHYHRSQNHLTSVNKLPARNYLTGLV